MRLTFPPNGYAAKQGRSKQGLPCKISSKIKNISIIANNKYVRMINMMNFDVWKLLVIFSLIAIGCNAKPYGKNGSTKSSISKRVEILDNKDNNYKKDQNSFRRQNVIHAGNDYDTTRSSNDPEPDELENLGKIIDYNGKIIDSAKSIAGKWKDAPGISKDVIERIKEIQDTLIKRTGTKDLAEKLKLMQPEKNVTIKSGSEAPLNSRKVIPEDVVNKILAKFQELREQAKTLASLDETKGKVDGKDSPERTVEAESSAKSDSGDSPKESSSPKDDRKVEEKVEPKQKPLSPYESIGPPKENEELKNITQSGVTQVPPTAVQSNDASLKAPEAQARDPALSDENDRMNQQAGPTPERMEGGQQNTPGNMMMMGNKVPMMFIKQGEMLVPVFGNQDGSSQQFQQPAPAPVVPTPQMIANMNLMPQASATQAGQSRSVPQTMTSQQVQVPSVPLSMIMSLMAGPRMINNLPASPMVPTQLNGGVYNVPQNPSMNQAGFMPQYQPGVMNNQPGADVPGAARQMLSEQSPSGGRDFMNEFQGQGPGGLGPQFGGLPFQGPGAPFPMPTSQQDQPSYQGQLSQFQRQFSPFQEQGSPFEEKPAQPTASFMGGFPGQSNAMGGPGPSSPGMGFGLAMDQSGKLSTVNPMNSGLMPMQPSGPLQSNPFQDTHPEARNNMEVLDKEKQMLNPYMSNSVNDLSDPMPNGEVSANTRNLDPDTLLELAKSRRTDPEASENMEANPDSLLENVKQGQLNRELSGPGDPERIGMNGMMTPQPSSPFAGTNPETLLDMLSKRNSKQIWSKDSMELERNAQNRIMEGLRQADQGLRRGSITQIGTNGMQGISSLPVLGQAGLDPSLADYTTNMLGNQAVDVSSKSLALNNPVESTFFNAAGGPRYRKPSRPNTMDVLSQDSLRFEHSRNSIDAGDDINPVNQADIYARHRISNPDITGTKRSMKSTTLPRDNIELRVNGQPLAEKGSLRSKIINGKVQKGKGKTLTSKSPVKIELSHADDAKKTKIVNIVTTGKYQLTDSKRDKVLKHDKFLNKFYKRT